MEFLSTLHSISKTSLEGLTHQGPTFNITCNLIYQSSSWEGKSRWAGKEVPWFYGNRRFVTVLKRSRHWSLSRARWIQFRNRNPTSLRSNLILSSHLHLGLPSGIFPSGFPTRTFYAFVIFAIRATCPSHPHPNNIWW